MSELRLETERTMTVKEVAEAMNIGASSVKRTIEKLRPVLGEVIKSRQGGYLLNEEQVTAIKLEVQKHHNLQNDSELPKTELEKTLIVVQAMKILNEEVETLQHQLTEAKPKIEFFDQVTNSKDAIDIGSAAKVLHYGGGRNKLFAFLRNQGILMQNNQPYQEYIDRGYFRTIEQKYVKPDGSTHINIKTVVYQKGLSFIQRLVKKGVAA